MSFHHLLKKGNKENTIKRNKCVVLSAQIQLKSSAKIKRLIRVAPLILQCSWFDPPTVSVKVFVECRDVRVFTASSFEGQTFSIHVVFLSGA